MSNTGLSAHERAHIKRAEAWGDVGQLQPTGNPIVKRPWDRKQRMEAIKRGEFVVGCPNTALALPNTEPVRPASVHLTHSKSTATIDLSQLTPDQVSQLQQQFVQPIRPQDRLREALVFTTVAEMLDDTSPEDLLAMLSQMRRMPLRKV